MSYCIRRIRLIWLRATSDYLANSRGQCGKPRHLDTIKGIKTESKKVLKDILEKDYYDWKIIVEIAFYRAGFKLILKNK